MGAMVRNLTVIWAPLLFALLLTTVQTEESMKRQQQQQEKDNNSSSNNKNNIKERKPQTQQKHSNAIMGEAGVTNSPMVDNPLAANYNYYDKNHNRHTTDDANQYDAPDDCHFAPYELSAAAGIITTTTLIPITSTSLFITTTTTQSTLTTIYNDNNNYHQQHEDITLTCNLRTVNSEFDTTNFSVIPAEHTLGLNVLCNNEIMAKSALESNSFAHLLRLRELTLQYCKFHKFPHLTLNGLTELRNLTVRTFNILWPTLNLDIEAGAFDAVKQLERLDLSTNNIWTLPAGVFCTLPALIMLNVSLNSLQDVNELGFREFMHLTRTTTTTTTTATDLPTTTQIIAAYNEPQAACNLDLEILDCSRNNFVLLPAYGFSALKRLRILLLQHNEISMLADRALSGLKNLQILNLNSNNIVALPAELFKEQLESIQEIYLANNSISVLTPNLFANLKQLQALDISFNQIISTWTNNETFIGLIRLVSLNLSHNRLTNLTNEIFIDLYTLQILNLRHNLLEQLQPHTFAPLHNLHTLLLSHNKLKYLDANALNGLYVLSLLSLDNNELAAVHNEAFRNCSSLQDLNLNGNHLEQVPFALRNMHLLRTVDLGENHISNITAHTFDGLNNLYGLRLISNELKNISKNCFKNLKSLQILNLARNSINYVETAAFDLIPDVQAIRLDGNQLTNIDNIFLNMPALLWLNISDNKLEYFDYSQVPNTLQWLDLHRNQLKELINSAGNDGKLRIQTLDLSFNKLQRINGASLPNSLRLVFLNNNQISTVEPDTFINKVNITRVDLYENHISTLDIKSLRIMSKHDNKELPEFYIGGNPYICDCNIDWLQKINYMRTRQYPRIMDLDTVFCKLLNNREHAFIPLVQAQPKHFLCNYKTHCFAVCHCCEFDACDCEMTCPNKCTCFHDQTWSTNIVECSGANYTATPSKVPMDTTELYMDGNNLIELNGYAFLGRKNLEVLYINASNVQFIYNTTFSGLKRLQVLHLESNLLEMLQGNEFDYLENLRALYLQNNNIYSIANGTFQILNKLQILRLDGNRLVHFEVWQLLHNALLMEIGLTDNQWSCECNYLMKFRNFLKYSAHKIVNLAHVSCIYNNATSVLIEQNGTKCIIRGADINAGNSYMSSGSLEQLLQILLVATFVFIGFFGAIFAFIFYRQRNKNWPFNVCNLNLCNRSSNSLANIAHDVLQQKERLNDAYFVYSLQDDQFVCQILAAVLERDIGYRLILHYRDIHMQSYLANALLETADSAKMLFIVLSKNFLYNEWSRFDYKAALHELIIKRRNRLTFILYGDLPQRDIDPDMRHFLRISTCIEWDDKKFWSKLRNTMPANLRPKSNNNERLSTNVSLYAAHEASAPAPQNTHTHTLNSQHAPSLLLDKRYATVNERTSHGGANSVCFVANPHNTLLPKFNSAALRQRAGQEPLTPDYAVPAYLNDCNCTKTEKCEEHQKLTATFSTNFVTTTTINEQQQQKKTQQQICHKHKNELKCHCNLPDKALTLNSRQGNLPANIANISLININNTLEQKKQLKTRTKS